MTKRRVGVVLVLVVAGFHWSPDSWWPGTRANAEAASFRALAAADTPDALAEVVELGRVIPLETAGGWVAIRYTDNHNNGTWSSAVARDSGGGWFVSDRHFCGYLQGCFAPQLDDYQGLPREARAVRDAPDLKAARSALVAMGFTPVPPPR